MWLNVIQIRPVQTEHFVSVVSLSLDVCAGQPICPFAPTFFCLSAVYHHSLRKLSLHVMRETMSFFFSFNYFWMSLNPRLPSLYVLPPFPRLCATKPRKRLFLPETALLFTSSLHWLQFFFKLCPYGMWNTQKACDPNNLDCCTQSFPSGINGPGCQGETMRSLLTLWLFAALPVLLWASHTTLFVEGDNDASRICKPPPNWDIKGRAPMKRLLGNVSVVALLKATWQFCLTQASK